MTQLELAEKLNYSDKSVSKWERADAIPDIYVLKQMSEIFGVTVDYLLSEHDGAPAVPAQSEHSYRTDIITTLSIVGIWTLAILLFVIFWLHGEILWIVFVYATPVSMITLLVMDSVWEKGRHNLWFTAALVAGVIASVYFTFFEHNWWQLFILLIPAEAVVFLSFHIKKRKKT